MIEDKATKNLEIWTAVDKTDPKHTKKFTGAAGIPLRNIDPVYRMKRLTEQFGPCGVGWGWVIERTWRDAFSNTFYDKESGEHVTEVKDCVYAQVYIWYVWEGERRQTGPQIGGTETGRTPDESYKMAVTDAFGKCAVALGLCADVYLGEFDNKYGRPETTSAGSRGPQLPPCPKCGKMLRTSKSDESIYCWRKPADGKDGCGATWKDVVALQAAGRANRTADAEPSGSAGSNPPAGDVEQPSAYLAAKGAILAATMPVELDTIIRKLKASEKEGRLTEIEVVGLEDMVETRRQEVMAV